MDEVDDLEPPKLQKIIEAVAITPMEATRLIDGYRSSFEAKYHRSADGLVDKKRIANRVINRYAKLSAAVGAAASLPGIIPGVGTAVAVVGGGVTDLAASLKLQVDMCMCLVEIFNSEMSGEDKKHMGFVLALAGSVEGMAANGGKAAVEKVAEKMVYQYLKGPALTTIKQLFKRVSISFTQKAMAKAVPLGVGVVFSGSANYVLTTVVGKVAVSVLAKEVK